MLQVVSEAVVDTKLTTLQSLPLKKRVSTVEYSNRTFELVSELECAAFAPPSIQQMCELLSGLPTECDVTVESIRGTEDGFHGTVSKLVFHESHTKQTGDRIESALIICKTIWRENVLLVTKLDWQRVAGTLKMRNMVSNKNLRMLTVRIKLILNVEWKHILRRPVGFLTRRAEMRIMSKLQLTQFQGR